LSGHRPEGLRQANEHPQLRIVGASSTAAASFSDQPGDKPNVEDSLQNRRVAVNSGSSEMDGLASQMGGLTVGGQRLKNVRISMGQLAMCHEQSRGSRSTRFRGRRIVCRGTGLEINEYERG
jgi:hypothetical protein